MSKKHEMSGQEYLIYEQQQPYEDTVDAEEEKIRNEKAGYVQHRKKGNTHIQQRLRNLTDLEDGLEAIEEDLELPEEDYIASRLQRNARTHKKRLTGLRKHESRAVSFDEDG